MYFSYFYSGRVYRLFLPVLLLCLTAAQPASTQTASPAELQITQSDTPMRLVFVDRQLMLNEMMAKSICYTDMRVDRKKHRNQLAASQYVFAQTLEGLIEGSPALNLQPEKRKELIEAIARLKAAWIDYTSAITSWSNARWGRKLFATKAYEVNEAFDKLLSETIKLYSQTLVADGSIEKDTMASLLLAGRQRMLTQRISKEFCQVATGLNTEPSREHLKQSLALFDASMKRLAGGDESDGASSDTPGEILDSIAKARATFAKVEPTLERVAAGSKPTEVDLEKIASVNDELLRHWVSIVSFYQIVLSR